MTDARAVIAEDEKYLRLSLKMILERLWPELHICGEAENGKEALTIIGETNPDIVFLDIKIPEMSGIGVAKKVYEKTWVVFVTAYDDYAIEAFESEAMDYLPMRALPATQHDLKYFHCFLLLFSNRKALKPVSEDRLEKTIRRLKRHLANFQKVLDFNLKMSRPDHFLS